MRYKDENEIAEFVGRFERGEIADADWRHRDHLTVALYYVKQLGVEAAIGRTRDGIFNLLRSFGIDPRGTASPYHETLTVFWVRELASFLDENADVPLAEIEEHASVKFDKDYPHRFYSRERLNGSLARREYVAPDLVAVN